VPNDIYEFSYTAKNPTVNGVGFAAVRDWNAWLRYATKDDVGTANPLAGDITRIYTEVSSQPGRLLNDFRYLDFNQADNGKQVFDGLMQWIAAGDGISMNYRWSQPGRTERNPRWTAQNRPLIDTSKPATTAWQPRPMKFYFVASSVRKSVWTLVRQLRGPHLSTCA
jgi:hypothetical protein